MSCSLYIFYYYVNIAGRHLEYWKTTRLPSINEKEEWQKRISCKRLQKFMETHRKFWLKSLNQYDPKVPIFVSFPKRIATYLYNDYTVHL